MTDDRLAAFKKRHYVINAEEMHRAMIAAAEDNGRSDAIAGFPRSECRVARDAYPVGTSMAQHYDLGFKRALRDAEDERRQAVGDTAAH